VAAWARIFPALRKTAGLTRPRGSVAETAP